MKPALLQGDAGGLNPAMTGTAAKLDILVLASEVAKVVNLS